MRPTVRQAIAQSGLVPVDAHVLLAHVMGADRAWLLAHATDVLASEQADAFFELAKRRREGEPVAYLVGRREFWRLDLRVTPDVLIPRPETETLVEAALARVPAGKPSRVLDLGTGSGAIALAIAHERPDAMVVATDTSPAALAVAQGNASRLALANVAFVRSSWYADVPPGDFDLIVSNPPYVVEGDAHLREGDLRHEPALALTAGADGLEALRVIVAGAPQRLAEGGSLILEHGHDQSAAVRDLLELAGLTEIGSARDLAGIPRVAWGRRRPG